MTYWSNCAFISLFFSRLCSLRQFKAMLGENSRCTLDLYFWMQNLPMCLDREFGLPQAEIWCSVSGCVWYLCLVPRWKLKFRCNLQYEKKDLATFAALQQRQLLIVFLCHFFPPLIISIFFFFLYHMQRNSFSQHINHYHLHLHMNLFTVMLIKPELDSWEP